MRGGGSYHGGGRGGGGRGSYHGGGRSHGGRGGRGRNHSRRPPDGQQQGPPALCKMCSYYINNGNCSNNNCTFSHCIKIITTIKHSDQIQNKSNYTEHHPTTDVALWTDPSGALKIFISSYDGLWRLYNVNNDDTNSVSITKEFQHVMGGPIDVLTVASNYLFCGFTGHHVRIPGEDNYVGMIHCWNLASPSEPPVELMMHPDYTPYAHRGRVSAFLTGIGDMCVSGGQDGVIRIWKYGNSAAGGKPGFTLVKECCGHVGEITGLIIVGGILWSCSTDATIRLWDAGGGGSVGTGSWECKYLITADTRPPGTGNPMQPPSNGGHTSAITALLPFEGPAGSFVMSSSLDGDVKIWNSSNGECTSSYNHGVGIVCMAITKDKEDNSILLCGTESGKIMIRMILQSSFTNEPMRLLASLDKIFIRAGHDGPVKQIEAGPGNTFYSVGSDGNFIVWQISNSFNPA